MNQEKYDCNIMIEKYRSYIVFLRSNDIKDEAIKVSDKISHIEDCLKDKPDEWFLDPDNKKDIENIKFYLRSGLELMGCCPDELIDRDYGVYLN